LQSLVNHANAPDFNDKPAIDTAFFESTAITNENGDADYPYYWTSTTHAGYSTTGSSGGQAAYIPFGRALGWPDSIGRWVDVHGAGCQRSDPKIAPPYAYATTHTVTRNGTAHTGYAFGPQGDAVRGLNFVRAVRDVVAPTIASIQVVEFYNTILDNYFITADPTEAAVVDSGGAGAGWSRTGNTFKSGGTVPVCRFYGSIAPGPNSHFYTADATECDSLKQLQAGTPATQKRWNFESLDFLTTVAVGGTCPSGRVPVYRAYNNGFARGVDSNHRITGSLTAIQQAVSRGWTNEGVAMCAPD